MSDGDSDLNTATIGELVKRFRNRQGMTQSELAQAIGVSDGMIGNVESGRRNLGIKALENVANVLFLSAGERDALRDARARHVAGAGLDRTDAPPAIEQLLSAMQSVSAGLRELGQQVRELRESVEQRLPPPDR